MSATIVQKSTTVANSHYYECGDIFQAVASDRDRDHLQQQQQQQQQVELVLDNSSMEQQHQQPHRLHGALTRTISQPAQQRHQLIQQQQQQQQQPVATLVTIIESLGNMNLHRKLERTQSEPLPQQPMNTSRYKTELCRPFEEAGECKYGEKCQFAHGYHELRNLQRHPKYKTEYCRTFHSVGFCPYGPRCHFVHNADEARAQQAAQAAKSSSQSQSQSQNQQQQSSPNFPSKNNNQNSNSNNSNSSSGSGNSSINISNNSSQFYLPLSPPLSMSTGSDRESPTGSLSLSPTNSLTSFPFHDALPLQQGYMGSNGATSNSSASSTSSASGLGLGMAMGMGMGQGMAMGQGMGGMGHHGPATPPESPNVPISPVHTPPPYDVVSGSGAGNNNGKQLLQKSVSTPMHQEETPRLPVFNRLSSAVEAYQQQSNLGL
ncbi:protein TIS11 [Drosophila rhopaloa]|uniref:Protein TIS11 n=1 Tax=Drosophila rhopaloa TaxID=1041015 RepID=A0A6P4FCA1_DRORH|nr:protein TIS11 [Drosophila rhopaloa]